MAAYILFLLIIESVFVLDIAYTTCCRGCWHFFLLVVIWMHVDGACLRVYIACK
jgi:hypothetical protein